MSQGPVWSIQYGFWNNHDYNSVLGTTLTATNNYGFLLISCITIFISFLGGQIWQMICFCLHQLRATSKDKDGLHHQIQAVLRNSQSASATMYEFIKMARAWNGHTKNPIRRLLPWIILAALESAAFTLAGIFANNIVGISHTVLLRSQTCGYATTPPSSDWGHYSAQDWEELDAWAHELRLSLTSALDYARSCYSTDMIKTGICEVYTVPSLSPTFQTVNCPFDDAICLDPTSDGSYQFNSGVINSNFDLGINAPPSYSVNYQRMTTCSPLQTNGYNQTVADSTITEDQYVTFNYGPSISPFQTNYTWAYPTLYPNFTNSPYALATQTYYNGGSELANSQSSFSPISQLNQTNGDITLIFLINNALYSGPVYDPWYFAQVEQADTEYVFGGNVWVANNPVSVMGCAELHRWCNPAVGNGSEQCSEWGPWASLYSFDSLSTDQAPVADALLNSAIITTSVGTMIQELSSDSLNAWLNVDAGHTLLTSQLPDDQWMYDIQNWMNTTLAQIQRSVVSVVTGPSTPAFNQFISPPPENYAQVFNVCRAQKVQDQRFYSFSVCWLIVLLSVGTFIIFCNMFLPDIMGWLRTKFHLDEEKKEDWDKDHLLQIQRIAFEANNLGKWRSSKGPDVDSAVPITSSGTYGVYGEVFGKPNRKSSQESVHMRQLHHRPGFKARQSDDDILLRRHQSGEGQRTPRSNGVTASVLGRGIVGSPPVVPGEAPAWDDDDDDDGSPPTSFGGAGAGASGGFPFPQATRIASSGSADFDSDTRALLRSHGSGEFAATGHVRSRSRESLTGYNARAYQPRFSPGSNNGGGGLNLSGVGVGVDATRYMRVVHEEEDEHHNNNVVSDEYPFYHPDDGSIGGISTSGSASGGGGSGGVVAVAAGAGNAGAGLGQRVDDEDITHMGIMR